MNSRHQMTLLTYLWKLATDSYLKTMQTFDFDEMHSSFDKIEIGQLITDTRDVIWVCKWFKPDPNLYD